MHILGHCVDLTSCIKSRKYKQGFPFDNFDFCGFKCSDVAFQAIPCIPDGYGL